MDCVSGGDPEVSAMEASVRRLLQRAPASPLLSAKLPLKLGGSLRAGVLGNLFALAAGLAGEAES